jgi:hypothetical protein
LKLPLFFNFVLEHAIKKVPENHEGLKLEGTHQLLVYVNDVNILGKNMHTIKKNTEALVSPIKKTGLKVNSEKTQCMVMPQD